MEMPRAWSETGVERRISLALLAGALLKAIAAACDPLPMGPWDVKAVSSAGRLANHLALHTANFVLLALKGFAPRTYRKISDPQSPSEKFTKDYIIFVPSSEWKRGAQTPPHTGYDSRNPWSSADIDSATPASVPPSSVWGVRQSLWPEHSG
jgi:hypothetical protein